MTLSASAGALRLAWKRCIRFTEKDTRRVLYGEPHLLDGVTSINEAKHATILKDPPFGGGPGDNPVEGKVAKIGTLLCPVVNTNVVRCLGLNYRPHAEEAKLPIPKYPIVFYKPHTAVSGPFDKIRLPLVAQQEPGIDYECELVVVIGKDCINVPEDKALDYVAGYTVGNDVSHRGWQFGLGGGQWNFSKSFDSWAPIGPGLVAQGTIGNKDPGQCTRPASGLKIWTKLNGKTVQEGWTGDMIFGVARALSFLSQGTTLEAGSLVFMGTPSGVGMSRKPPLWLKHGDIVEVGLEGVGSCVNTVHDGNQNADSNEE